MTSEKSRMLPSVSGYWKMIPPMSLALKSTLLTSTISTLIPNGRALVTTQLIVWGCSLSDRRNLKKIFSQVIFSSLNIISSNFFYVFLYFLPLSLVDPVAEPQGLGRGGALVQETGVSHLQSSKVTDLTNENEY